MLNKLLPSYIFAAIKESVDNVFLVNEIRLRLNQPVTFSISADFFTVKNKYCVKRQDIEAVLSVASGNALYAMSDKIVEGFLNFERGIRIGIAGECVRDRQEVLGVKNISSLVIRIPKELKGCSCVLDIDKRSLENVLIISPPYGGKTTFVRDLARRTSNLGINTVLIDERYELSGIIEGNCSLDIGSNTDVLAGMDKKKAYQIAVRSLNPSLIVTDEVWGIDEERSVSDIIRSGVKVYATVHGNDYNSLKRMKGDFVTLFDRIITLGNREIGKVLENIKQNQKE